MWVGGKLVDAESADTGAGSSKGSSEFDDIDDSLLKRGDEDKKAAGGKDDWKKAFEGTTGTTDGTLTDEDGRALPAAWLPDAVPCAMIFGLMTATALFFLLCHWLVSFKALALFSPTNSVKAGSYLFVQPHPHRGKAQIVKVHACIPYMQNFDVFLTIFGLIWSPRPPIHPSTCRLSPVARRPSPAARHFLIPSPFMLRPPPRPSPFTLPTHHRCPRRKPQGRWAFCSNVKSTTTSTPRATVTPRPLTSSS